MVKIIKNGIEVESFIDPSTETEMELMEKTLRKYKEEIILSTTIKVVFKEGTVLSDSMPEETEKIVTIELI